MPYIKAEDRSKFDIGLGRLDEDIATRGISQGELNYLITQLCQSYIASNGKSYATINDLVGVLECSKLEFYRRIAAPYEDKKITENGDVYTE